MDLLSTKNILIGDRLEAIAYCSHVEILQNLTSVGSFREVYHLHGVEQSFLPAILFKNSLTAPVDTEMFGEAPVTVKGIVSEYKGVQQLTIESITYVGDKVDVMDLLSNMADTKIIDEVNDFLFSQDSMVHFSRNFIKPALGLKGSLAGTLLLRIQRLLEIGFKTHPVETAEYIENLSLIADYYLTKEGNTDDKIDLVSSTKSRLVRALLFGTKDYTEYDEYVKLHHLLMKPKGVTISVVEDIIE